MKLSWLILGLAWSTLVLGCGSGTIPQRAFEGTTIAIAIPANFDVGYGTKLVGDQATIDAFVANSATQPALNYGNLTQEDLQRGELVFTLYDPSTSVEHGLEVSWITSVAPHAAALNAVANQAQPIALLNLPVGLVSDAEGSGVFRIKVDRWRRDASGVYQRIPQTWFRTHDCPTCNPYPTNWETVDWSAWGNPSSDSPGLQYIEIGIDDIPGVADASEVVDHTPLDGWGATTGAVWPSGYPVPWVKKQLQFTMDQQLPNHVPLPEFRVLLGAGANPPAAFTLDLTFPNSRMSVQGVRALRANPSEATVVWRADPSVIGAGCSSTSAGTAEIHVADPAKDVTGVAIVFQLENVDNVNGCWGRIDEADVASGALSITNVSGGNIEVYDENGQAYTISSPVFNESDLL